MTTLMAGFEAAGVKHVHIVDDAFDNAPTAELEPAAIQTFLDSLDDTRFASLCTALEIPNAGEEAVIAKLSGAEGAMQLYDSREAFGAAADALFADFAVNQAGEKSRVQPLVDFFRGMGVSCHTFGRDYDPQGTPAPDIIFVDLKLQENSISLDDCTRVIERMSNEYHGAAPLVFLMSSWASRLPEYRNEFKNGAKLFESQFEAIPKKTFEDSEELSMFLNHHVRALPLVRELQASLAGWTNALDEAKGRLIQILRGLDISDYVVLHRNTTSVEGVELGTYVTDLLIEYIEHQIEASQDVWRFARFLNEWDPSKVTRTRFSLEPVVGDLYSANVLHAKARLDAESASGRGPEKGFLSLGDVFLGRDEIRNGKIRRAWIVISPACDLVRPDVIRERQGSVLLCEGEASDLKPSSVPKEEDGLPPTIIRYPVSNGPQYVINWKKKRFLSWTMDQIDSLANGEAASWVLAARVRPLYALQLQHAVTADLGRVGVQRAPDTYVPHGIEVLIAADGKKWTSLLSTYATNPRAGAVSQNRTTRKAAFILSDEVVRELVRRLRDWVRKNSASEQAKILEGVLGLNGLAQRLVTFHHTWPLANQPVVTGPDTSVVLPLDGAEANLDDEIRKALVVVVKNRSEHATYAAGKSLQEGSLARVAIRFIKLTN